VSLSESLGRLVEQVAPAVVRVEAGRRLPGSGTAFSTDGVIVTADHVVEQDGDIRVGLADGRLVPAALVGRDPTTDVAVLRAEAGDLASPSWAEVAAVRAGHLAVALARPGRTIRAAFGVVDAVSDDWLGPGGFRLDRYIQVDAALQPGFSGGPVLDASGAVLGMTTSGLLRGSALAIPAPTVRRIVDTLLRHGRVRRGYLGIGAHPIRLPEPVRRQTGDDAGLMVMWVEPGSPAEQAGLILGDVVMRLDGTVVRRLRDMMGALTEDRIGTAVTARILRSGQVIEVSIVIGERGRA
jgi:S1-C subfamily serine protease